MRSLILGKPSFEEGLPRGCPSVWTLLAPHPMLKKQSCGADISATFKRTEFSMAKFVPMVSDEVKIYSPVETLGD